MLLAVDSPHTVRVSRGGLCGGCLSARDHGKGRVFLRVHEERRTKTAFGDGKRLLIMKPHKIP